MLRDRGFSLVSFPVQTVVSDLVCHFLLFQQGAALSGRRHPASPDSPLLSSVVVETVACLCQQVGGQAAPADDDRQMFYSTVSSLDRRASLSSDEDEDIYCQTGRDVSTCAPNKTDKTSERQLAPDVLNRSSLKADQVGRKHLF